MNFVLRIASNFNFILFSFQYLLHCERRNKNYQDYSANVFVFWTRVEKPCFIVGFVFPSLSQVFSIWLHPNELCMLSKVLISPFFISFHADFSFMHFHERKKKHQNLHLWLRCIFCAADVSLVLNDDFKNKVLCAIANRFWIYSRFEYILTAFALHHLNATKCFCLNKISVIAVTNPCNGVHRTANYIPFARSLFLYVFICAYVFVCLQYNVVLAVVT